MASSKRTAGQLKREFLSDFVGRLLKQLRLLDTKKQVSGISLLRLNLGTPSKIEENSDGPFELSDNLTCLLLQSHKELPIENKEENLLGADRINAIGNKFAEEGNYLAATSRYDLAIQSYAHPVYFLNRAASNVCYGQTDKAFNDCCSFFAQNPAFIEKFLDHNDFKSVGQVNSDVTFWIILLKHAYKDKRFHESANTINNLIERMCNGQYFVDLVSLRQMFFNDAKNFRKMMTNVNLCFKKALTFFNQTISEIGNEKKAAEWQKSVNEGQTSTEGKQMNKGGTKKKQRNAKKRKNQKANRAAKNPKEGDQTKQIEATIESVGGLSFEHNSALEGHENNAGTSTNSAHHSSQAILHKSKLERFNDDGTMAHFDVAVMNVAQSFAISGELLLTMGRLDEAAGNFSNAYEKAPRPVYLVRRSSVSRRLKRFDDAIRDCENAISLNGNYAYAKYQIGKILTEKGLIYTQMALNIDPDIGKENDDEEQP